MMRCKQGPMVTSNVPTALPSGNAGSLVAGDIDSGVVRCRWVTISNTVAISDTHDGVATFVLTQASPILADAIGPLAHGIFHEQTQFCFAEGSPANVFRCRDQNFVAIAMCKADHSTWFKSTQKRILIRRSADVVSKSFLIVDDSIERAKNCLVDDLLVIVKNGCVSTNGNARHLLTPFLNVGTQPLSGTSLRQLFAATQMEPTIVRRVTRLLGHLFFDSQSVAGIPVVGLVVMNREHAERHFRLG